MAGCKVGCVVITMEILIITLLAGHAFLPCALYPTDPDKGDGEGAKHLLKPGKKKS